MTGLEKDAITSRMMLMLSDSSLLRCDNIPHDPILSFV
jgi:hypothetical protein